MVQASPLRACPEQSEGARARRVKDLTQLTLLDLWQGVNAANCVIIFVTQSGIVASKKCYPKGGT